MSKKTLLKPIIILCAVLLLLAGIAWLTVSLLTHAKNDKLLKTSEYNCVFLSMFPIDTFREEDFSHYRGDDVLLLKYEIPSYQIIKRYLKDVKLSENEMHSVYLGIDPRKVSAEQILELHEVFPEVTFEIFPAYRRLSDWMKDWRFGKTYNTYLDLTEKLLDQDFIHVYSFFAQEWLIADDANYVKGNLLTERVAGKVYVYADVAHHCIFTKQNIANVFNSFSRLLTETKENGYKFPDLSSWDVVMFGDSIIGNYVEHDSIPGLLSAMTGARTYNCGWGGASASGAEASSGHNVINAYLTKDLSSIPDDVAARDGIQKRLEDESEASSQKLLFILHYGINDYLNGRPLDNASNPLDTETFCGAMRKMIETLQENRPGAKILLIAPNTITCFENGSRVHGENGAPLSDYADAVLRIGSEYGLPVQDDYHVVLSADIAEDYLGDQLHPNEYGRYKITQELIRQICGLHP